MAGGGGPTVEKIGLCMLTTHTGGDLRAMSGKQIEKAADPLTTSQPKDDEIARHPNVCPPSPIHRASSTCRCRGGPKS